MLMICIICVCLLVRFLLTSGGFWGASLKNCRGCKTKYLGIAEVQIDFRKNRKTNSQKWVYARYLVAQYI